MLQKIKRGIADLFADRAGKWSKVDDYLIVGMIIVSTIEITLSTFSNFSVGFQNFLGVINSITIAFFTIEVSLRIWTAGEVDPQYKGWRGKIKYCCSFWGVIDIISTYPYYLTLFLPVPMSVVTVLRVLRIFRIFRFVEAFDIITAAIKAKKQEMWVSLQFLFLITLVLSISMYYVEYNVQPENCDSGVVSIIWAFMQYVGDPGHFSDFEPITLLGRIIATVIGILGIAIFAVPAGLIGSAFIEVIEERRSVLQPKEDAQIIIPAFKHKLCRITKYYHLPRYMTVRNLQAITGLPEHDILNAATSVPELRLSNLAYTFSATDNPIDNLIVEYLPINRSYGVCIDRSSSVTIVATSNSFEPGMAHFAYNLARIGGFNYVSKEIAVNKPNSYSYYNLDINPKIERCPNVDDFLSDIHSLAPDDKHWVIFMISASGQEDPVYPHDVQFNYGSQLGNNTFEDQKLTFGDVESFKQVYQELDQTLTNEYNHPVCRQNYYAIGAKNACWQFHNDESDVNAFAMRISYAITCWDIKALEIATKFAESFNRHFENNKPKELDLSHMRKRGEGYEL